MGVVEPVAKSSVGWRGIVCSTIYLPFRYVVIGDVGEVLGVGRVSCAFGDLSHGGNTNYAFDSEIGLVTEEVR